MGAAGERGGPVGAAGERERPRHQADAVRGRNRGAGREGGTQGAPSPPLLAGAQLQATERL